jgi:glycosyltransferase involved in cell wall biosynthesis
MDLELVLELDARIAAGRGPAPLMQAQPQTAPGVYDANDASRRASVVIPAHNEAVVIGRCLDSLFAGIEPGALDVVVVCNGCADETAQVARACGHPVRVLELDEASKAAALRAGDAVARGYPRLYVDADVILAGQSACAVARRLAAGAIAARPPISYATEHASPLVRSYYRARTRLPAVMSSLWGAGVYGLSAAGRSRFGPFPDVGADDLWVDRLFERGEVEIIDCAPVVVAVPHRARDLLHVLRRTYRGKTETAPEAAVDERARATTASALSELRHLAASGPAAAVDASVYAGFALGARLALAWSARRGRSGASPWERDESSRATA